MDPVQLVDKAEILATARADYLAQVAIVEAAQGILGDKVAALHTAYQEFIGEADIDYPPP